jgi:hypothetical protein
MIDPPHAKAARGALCSEEKACPADATLKSDGQKNAMRQRGFAVSSAQ